MARVPTVVLLALLLAACSDDDNPPSPDSAVPDATDDGPVPFTLPPGDKGHADVGATLGPGQVRAGQVTAASQLLSGVKVEGGVGDYKIYNSKVAFIIQGVRPSDGSAPYGGEVLDAARLDDGTAQDSALGEVVLGLSTYILNPTSVGVVQDGSDGGEAVVRAIGEPVIFPSLGAVLGAAFGGQPPVYMVLDYALAADAADLEIRVRVFNKTRKEVKIPIMAVSMSAGDGVEFFAEGYGFDVNSAPARNNIAAVGPAVGYALVSSKEKLMPVIHYEGLWIHTVDGFTVPAAGESQYLYQLLVAHGDPEGLVRELRQLRGEAEPPTVSGVVQDPTGQPVADARVHVQTAGSTPAYVTMARTDAQGAYKLGLAPGSYLLNAVVEGRLPLLDVKLDTTGAATKDLTLGGTAEISYTVTDDGGAALPAKLIVHATPAYPALPASFGERVYPGEATLIQFAPTGKGTAPLPPGNYTVTASRGFEYEIDQATLALVDGESKPVALQLKRSVDTTGYLCGDFHMHTLHSADCSETHQDKVAALAGEGVEIAVLSEHDYIGDLGPAVKALGLQSWVHAIMGHEVTTFTYGHFNAFPVTQDPSQSNQGAMDWTDKSPKELFAAIHTAWPGGLVQINHPRSASVVGFFTTAGYDPKTGKVSKPAMWSTDFDTFEVFNGKRLLAEGVWPEPLDRAPLDWFSLLDRGLLVTATGGSDSHDRFDDPVGYPRNCVRLASDDPSTVDNTQLVAAIKQQRVVVSGGPFVSIEVGAKTVGEVAPFSAKSGALKVVVQAPTWMPADTLRVYVGGVEAHKVTLDASTADPLNPVVRYDDSLTIQAQQDSWVVAVVTSSKTLAPVIHDDLPFAMTNPIYLDVDGNGKYDPPLGW